MNSFEERLSTINTSLDEIRTLIQADGSVEGIASEFERDLQKFEETISTKDRVIEDLQTITIVVAATIEEMEALENLNDATVCVIIAKTSDGVYENYQGTYIYSSARGMWIKAETGMNLAPKYVQNDISYLSDSGEMVGCIADKVGEAELSKEIFNAIFGGLVSKLQMNVNFAASDVLNAIIVDNKITPMFYIIDWSGYSVLDLTLVGCEVNALTDDMLAKFMEDCNIIVASQEDKDYLLSIRSDFTNITIKEIEETEGGE